MIVFFSKFGYDICQFIGIIFIWEATERVSFCFSAVIDTNQCIVLIAISNLFYAKFSIYQGVSKL